MDKKEYDKLVQVFHDDENLTFREHLKNMWDEAKNITKVWITMGAAVAVFLAGYAGYRYQASKQYIRNEYFNAFKQEAIAACNYNNNPSETHRRIYKEKRNNLDEIVNNVKVLKNASPKQILDLYSNTLYESNCKSPDLDSLKISSCYIIFGDVLEKTEISRSVGGKRRIVGAGYLIRNPESHNFNLKKSAILKKGVESTFIIVADESLQKKDYGDYLIGEIRKLMDSEKKN
jgi:hypothetical protein